MTLAPDDCVFMREAIALARLGTGTASPNPMVGAVIVKNGQIIGRGFHQRAGGPHAEINAFTDAGKNGANIAGATLYVTLEPCCTTGRTPPCTDAVIANGITRVVAGATDPHACHNGRGLEILRQAGIKVDTGVCGFECAELNRAFFKWISTGKPFVTLKLAVTLDGKIANKNGISKWITGEEARKRVQALRLESDAVMVSGKTVRADHPSLTVRDLKNRCRQPLRLIATRSMNQKDLLEYFPDGNFEIIAPDTAEEWHTLMLGLGAREITSILIEGGGELAAAAINAGTVDFVEMHIAPVLMGGRDSRPAIGVESPENLDMMHRLKSVNIFRYGQDIAISGYLNNQAWKDKTCSLD